MAGTAKIKNTAYDKKDELAVIRKRGKSCYNAGGQYFYSWRREQPLLCVKSYEGFGKTVFPDSVNGTEPDCDVI